LRSLLTSFLDALMSAEADVICGAPRVPSPDQVNVRNSYRHRDFDAPGRHDRRGDSQAPLGQLFPGLAAGTPAARLRRRCPGRRCNRCRTHYAASLMQVTPKASWPWAKTMLHSVRPARHRVRGRPVRPLVEAVHEKLPNIAAHLDSAPSDVLAFTVFPKGDLASDLVQQTPGTAQPRDPGC
jgi:transposase-like protein